MDTTSRVTWYDRPRRVLLALVLLAAPSGVSLALATSVYLDMARLRIHFELADVRVEAPGAARPEELAVYVRGPLENPSSWPLQVTSLWVRLHVGESYLWGENYDWRNTPLALRPQGSVPLDLVVRLPSTKAVWLREVAALGPFTWQVQVGGLIDVPRIGPRPFSQAGSHVDRGEWLEP